VFTWLEKILPATVADVKQTKQEVLMKVSELADKLTALDTQLGKAQAEINAEIDALKAALNNVEIPAAAQAAIDNLSAKVQALDDLNPDAPTA
jgi:hypothetical protein